MALRDVVTVTGADARRYLQSQLAQDVDALAVGESRWTLVLAPAGRVEALARIHRTGENTYELDTDPGFGEALAARLTRFKIRVDADIVSSARDIDPTGLVGWWDRPTTDDGEPARVAAGWPAMGTEIVPGETIPAETGLAAVAVSFTKGCYPGQELVERMDSRGAKPPRLLRVFDVGPGVAAGDPIVDASGAEVGTYTSVAAGKALGYVRRGAALTSEV
jgi:tRNA-modifying protein YgfZ